MSSARALSPCHITALSTFSCLSLCLHRELPAASADRRSAVIFLSPYSIYGILAFSPFLAEKVCSVCRFFALLICDLELLADKPGFSVEMLTHAAKLACAELCACLRLQLRLRMDKKRMVSAKIKICRSSHLVIHVLCKHRMQQGVSLSFEERGRGTPLCSAAVALFFWQHLAASLQAGLQPTHCLSCKAAQAMGLVVSSSAGGAAGGGAAGGGGGAGAGSVTQPFPDQVGSLLKS